MKVSEAKEKVCPFMSDSLDIDLGSGYAQKGNYSKCICGDCMAWQYIDEMTKSDCRHETEDGYCKRIGK